MYLASILGFALNQKDLFVPIQSHSFECRSFNLLYSRCFAIGVPALLWKYFSLALSVVPDWDTYFHGQSSFCLSFCFYQKQLWIKIYVLYIFLLRLFTFHQLSEYVRQIFFMSMSTYSKFVFSYSGSYFHFIWDLYFRYNDGLTLFSTNGTSSRCSNLYCLLLFIYLFFHVTNIKKIQVLIL